MKKHPSKCTLIILGETLVGKTSLICRFDSNSFNHITLSTIGIDNIRKNITLKNNKEIELSIYDTAGQGRYHPPAGEYQGHPVRAGGRLCQEQNRPAGL